MSIKGKMSGARKADFWTLKPSLVGFVGDFAFYEDPWEGDESTLIAEDLETGEVSYTDFWELPKKEELA